MKKLLQSLFVLMLLAISVTAQDKRITGKVIGKEDGLPLPGVSVRVTGTNLGTQTSGSGDFTLNVPSNAKSLEISYIGFLSQTITIGSKSVINVSLEANNKQLSEVVVVAYGSTKKEAITGSVASLDAKDLTNRPITNINNALAGIAPGIQTNSGSGQPGAGPSVRIRGFGSISASNDPLYVVDGVPYSGNVSNINVEDIESVSILKDASSAALYGARAANGVIIITTKKGKAGKDDVNIKVVQGISSRGIKEYERLDPYQYYPAAWEAYRNSLVYPATGTPLTYDVANLKASNEIKGLLAYNPFNVPGNAIVGTDGKINPSAFLLYNDLDWAEPLKRTGNRSDYSFSTSGGSAKTNYYVSLGYLNDKGYVIRSDFNRYNGRLNLNSNPLKWFKTGLNLSGNITKSNQASGTGGTSYVNPFFFSRNIGPIYPVYAHNPTTGEFLLDANGEKIYDLGNLASLGSPTRPANASPGRHVVAETNYNDNLFKRNVLGARTFGTINFLKDFEFTTNVSVDISNYLGSTYENKIVGDGAPAGRANKTNSTTTSYNLNELLRYSKSFDKHNVEVLAGHENYDYNYVYFTGSRNTQILDGNTELINFTTTSDLTTYTDKYRTEGVFSKVSYNYDEKYFLNASFRRDGTSRFSEQSRWGNFYSLGAAWNIGQEKFMQKVKWIDYLKLRGSYGEVGNDGLLNSNGSQAYYKYQAFYDLDYNNAAEPGLRQSSLGTPDLHWENNSTTDIGLEFALFKNRLNGSFEVFDRRSKDLLFDVPLPVSVGITSISRNIGTMYNKGIEINLGGDILKSKSFGWNANVNWTTIKNQITKMPEETPTIISGTKQLAVGHSIYEYWLRDFRGVDPADGSALYTPLATATTDLRTIDGEVYTINPNNAIYDYRGSAIPDFYGSLTNTFDYKAFSLSVLLNYQVGGKAYDGNYAALMTYSGYGGALHKDQLNSWKAPGDISNIPRLDVGRSSYNNAGSTRWLINASYLTFKATTLYYTLPKSLISKASVKNARVYISGENLLLFSKRQGLDPTQSFTGVNTNDYVPTRIVSLGLNVTL